MKSPRVLKQIEFASCLKAALEKLIGSPVPVLLQDESYTSWRAFRDLQSRDKILKRSSCQKRSLSNSGTAKREVRPHISGVDSDAACLLIHDLFRSASRNGLIETFRL